MEGNDSEDLNINKRSIFPEENFDLNIFIKFLRRNKRLISYFAVGGFTISALLSLGIKRTWQGGFQIVLDQEESKMDLGNNRISALVGLNNVKEILTEVEILKSPSLLLDIYEFVKIEKDNSDLDFIFWKKNLKVKLTDSTSILNIDYQDNDKDLIISVLSKISEKYQKYSTKQKDAFYDNQIKIIKDLAGKNILYTGGLIANFSENELVKSYYKVNSQLNNKRNIYVEDDIHIRDLKIIKNNLIKIINEQTLSIINAQKVENKDTWKLITSPTLLPYPVAPQRKRIALLGLLSGIIIGSGISYWIERKKDIIYLVSELRNLSKFSFTIDLSSDGNKELNEKMDLISLGSLSQTIGNILVLSLSNENTKVDMILKNLKKNLRNRKILTNTEISASNTFENIFIIVELGASRKKEFIKLINNLENENYSSIGIFII